MSDEGRIDVLKYSQEAIEELIDALADRGKKPTDTIIMIIFGDKKPDDLSRKIKIIGDWYPDKIMQIFTLPNELYIKEDMDPIMFMTGLGFILIMDGILPIQITCPIWRKSQ